MAIPILRSYATESITQKPQSPKPKTEKFQILIRTTSHSPKWVLADGTFDPIHAGHLRYLQTAARYGTRHGLRLLVRVAPDAVIRVKGREPFQTQHERAEMLRQLRCVDDVCIDPTLEDAIARYRPVALIKGPDWMGRIPVEVLLMCHDIGTVIQFTHRETRRSTERLAG